MYSEENHDFWMMNDDNDVITSIAYFELYIVRYFMVNHRCINV